MSGNCESCSTYYDNEDGDQPWDVLTGCDNDHVVLAKLCSACLNGETKCTECGAKVVEFAIRAVEGKKWYTTWCGTVKF